MELATEFTPLQSNGNTTKSFGTRLRIDNYLEHRKAAEYLQEKDIYGEGSKTLVLALLYYRDHVVKPLERLPISTSFEDLPEELKIERRSFTVVPQNEREHPARVRNVSVRLYIDRWKEHKEAYNFLQKQQKLYANGGKTIVRALLSYKNAEESS